MDKIQLYTQVPWPWSLACLVLALGYAWLLYGASSEGRTYGKVLRGALAGLRFVVALALLLLLLQPVLRYTSTVTDQPKLVIAIDDSESIKIGTTDAARAELKAGLVKANNTLQEAGISTEIRRLSEQKGSANQTADPTLAALTYNAGTSDLSGFLTKIRNDFENRHLSGIVLVSDGLYNQGTSPDFVASRVPIYTVGIGDTIPKQDLSIKAVNYNRISYLGNKFMVQAVLSNYGYQGQTSRLVLSKDGAEIVSQIVRFGSKSGITELNLTVPATTAGQQHYVLSLVPLAGEYSKDNNQVNLYIDVIDGKERIVIAASAPHPDVKALRSALESLGNLEVSVWMPSLGTVPGVNELKPGKPDLVILHQLPDVLGTGATQLQQWASQGVPMWYFIGGQTNFTALNALQPAIVVQPKANQQDKVSGTVAPTFARFNVPTDLASLLPKLPPIEVPFGQYNLGPQSDVILNQSLGSVAVGKPLLAVSSVNGRKSAVFAGLGLWQWRLQSFVELGNQTAIDQLIQRTALYLSAKDDKRKLRCYPVNTEIYEQDQVALQTELYNDLYEPIYNQPVTVKVSTKGQPPKSFTVTPTESNNKLNIGVLKPGVYTYEATATVGGKAESTKGQFTVQALQLEASNTTANFALLREVAAKSGGAFAPASQVDGLVDKILKQGPKGQIRSFEDLSDLVNIKVIAIVIAALAILEWFIRKLKGAY